MAYFDGCPYGNGPRITTIVCDPCYHAHGEWEHHYLKCVGGGVFDDHWHQAAPWRWSPRWSMTATECAWGSDGHLVDTPLETAASDVRHAQARRGGGV